MEINTPPLPLPPPPPPPPSQTRTLWNSLVSKSEKFSLTLKTFLLSDEKINARISIILAQFALFFIPFSFRKTNLFAKQSSQYGELVAEAQAMFIYLICSIFLTSSKLLSKYFTIRRRYNHRGNYTANVGFLFLGMFCEKFFEKSIGSFYLLLNISVLILILLVIIRPWTDFGLFGFVMGLFGSVAYNLFGFKPRIIQAIIAIFVLFGLKLWLDQNWLEQDSRNLNEPNTEEGRQLLGEPMLRSRDLSKWKGSVIFVEVMMVLIFYAISWFIQVDFLLPMVDNPAPKYLVTSISDVIASKTRGKRDAHIVAFSIIYIQVIIYGFIIEIPLLLLLNLGVCFVTMMCHLLVYKVISCIGKIVGYFRRRSPRNHEEIHRR